MMWKCFFEVYSSGFDELKRNSQPTEEHEVFKFKWKKSKSSLSRSLFLDVFFFVLDPTEYVHIVMLCKFKQNDVSNV